jgi:hypothetical protein
MYVFLGSFSDKEKLQQTFFVYLISLVRSMFFNKPERPRGFMTFISHLQDYHCFDLCSTCLFIFIDTFKNIISQSLRTFR